MNFNEVTNSELQSQCKTEEADRTDWVCSSASIGRYVGHVIVAHDFDFVLSVLKGLESVSVKGQVVCIGTEPPGGHTKENSYSKSIAIRPTAGDEESQKGSISPRRGVEPVKRKRQDSVTNEVSESLGTIFKDCVDVRNLPQPNATKLSPDEYLLQLVKAQVGLNLEVKQAFSLESFFSEVTEEQMAGYTVQVVSAVRNNDLESLKKLHTEGQPLNCFNRFGEGLLNMACRRGFETIVEHLLEQPDINLRVCDDGGRTPLHDACWHPSPQLSICKWILERDPALFFISDRRGCTAFQYARPEHWDIWRKFLFDNRECFEALTKPEILSRLVSN